MLNPFYRGPLCGIRSNPHGAAPYRFEPLLTAAIRFNPLHTAPSRFEPLEADPDGCHREYRRLRTLALVLLIMIVIGVRLQWRFG